RTERDEPHQLLKPRGRGAAEPQAKGPVVRAARGGAALGARRGDPHSFHSLAATRRAGSASPTERRLVLSRRKEQSQAAQRAARQKAATPAGRRLGSVRKST